MSSTTLVLTPPSSMVHCSPLRANFTSPTILQEILIHACNHFKVSPYLYSLYIPPSTSSSSSSSKSKSSSSSSSSSSPSPVDLTLPLRLTSLHHGQKVLLEIVKPLSSHLSPMDDTMEGKLSEKAKKYIENIQNQCIEVTIDVTNIPNKVENNSSSPSSPSASPSPLPPLVSTFPLSSSLSSILSHFQSLYPHLQLSEYFGLPPVTNSVPGISLHINRPGKNVPIVEFGGKKWGIPEEKDKDKEKNKLEEITLFHMGMRNDTAVSPSLVSVNNETVKDKGGVRKVKCKISFHYIPPSTTQDERQEIFDNFNKNFTEKVAQQEGNNNNNKKKDSSKDKSESQYIQENKSSPSPSPSSSSPPSSSSSSSSPSLSPPWSPPPRSLRLFYSLSHILPTPDLPDEFYEITDEDSQMYAKSIIQSKQLIGAMKAHEGNGELSSSSSSSLPPNKRRRDYQYTRIRIRLPHHLYLEGNFHVNETVKDMEELVISVLKDEKTPFYLFLSPPKQILSEKKRTLRSLGLVQSAIVLLGIHTSFTESSEEKERENTQKSAKNTKIEVLPDDYKIENTDSSPARHGPSNNSAEIQKRAAESVFYSISEWGNGKKVGEGIIKDDMLGQVEIVKPPQINNNNINNNNDNNNGKSNDPTTEMKDVEVTTDSPSSSSPSPPPASSSASIPMNIDNDNITSNADGK